MSRSYGAHKRARRLLLLLVAVSMAASMVPGHAVTRTHAAGVDPDLAARLLEARGSIPVIVRFVSQPTAADARALREAGFTGPMVSYAVVPAVAASAPASAIRRVARNPRVAHVSLDAVIPYTLDRATTAGRARQTWTAEYKDVDGLHATGFTGRGVGIAIVDTGVDATHPDLRWKPLADAAGEQPKTVANFKIAGRDSAGLAALAGADGFVHANMLAVDMPHTDNTGGHGTHCAGIAAGTGAASNGKYRGAAPGANLIGFGAGETLVISLGLAAFDYIHLHHEDPALNIRVVSNSWGGPGDWNPESPVTIAARQLVADGLVVLFAAGNNGGDGSTIQTSVWANIEDPGIISVANYYDRTGWLDGSSSRGRRNLERTWPDLAASGTEVISTSATAGPVSYFGTGQDAALNHLNEYGEPDVITAPAAATPVTVEQNVGGQDVVVGPYASFTGTSMATPFVAGVAALVLEANPALSPQDVRLILRETANMLPGRRYDTDGYALGKGVVDAAEAVAVALRMKAGDDLAGALRNAYVDTGGPTFKINMALPRRVLVDSPAGGASVSGSSLAVEGRFVAGPVTDNTVPLLPPVPPPVPLQVTGTPHIYLEGQADPFVAGGHTVVRGRTVTLSVRTINSNKSDVSAAPDNIASASHVVLRNGSAAFGPFDATVAANAASRTDTTWTVPVDAPLGDYVFQGSVTLKSGKTFITGSLPFSIAGADAPAAAGGSATSDATFFSEGFETGTEGWTVQQKASPGPGLLTTWSVVENCETCLTWAGFHGDGNQRAFYAGDVGTATAGSSGLFYEQGANADLISPVIDLTNSQTAELSYWRAGMSAADYHFLRVWVAEDKPNPSWTALEQASGDFVNTGRLGQWEESTLDLAEYVGLKVRLRFQFDAVTNVVGIFYPMPLVGWYVDDIAVTGVPGTPPTTLSTTFTGLPLSGVGSLATSFAFSGRSNKGIASYSLDFGDGSPVFTSAAAGGVQHTYGVGQWTATLTVTATDGTTKSVTLPVDVAPVEQVQVRIAGGRWVDAGPASGADAAWSAVLDLTGLASGPTTIDVRHFDADGNRVVTSIPVTIV